MEQGEIKDWEAMETLWRETFYDKLRVSPENREVLVTEKPGTDKDTRENTTKIFFEKLEVHAFSLANPGVLSLYATGSVTGLAIIADEDFASVVPVQEGYAVKAAMQNLTEESGISEAVQDSISNCDIDIRGELYKNIVLVSTKTSTR